MRGMAASTLYSDPRIVSLYDTLNPSAADTAFYLELAVSRQAARIVDIGCGTGLLTCELAMRGHDVVGIDPSDAMLAVARSGPGGERVTWIEGNAGSATTAEADLVIMTGHVAQVFLDDASWRSPLAATHRALRPGGCLAFASRNPATQPWTMWTPEASRRRIYPDAHGAVEVWLDVIDVERDRVRFNTHYRFERDGDEIVSSSELRFRTQDELIHTLTQTGFVSIQWYGDWSCAPVNETSRELIAIAVRE
jgi:SAM-dependent methyltransferase